MKVQGVYIVILISSAIAQAVKQKDYLSSEIDKEYQNVDHLLASLHDAWLQELPNDPTCLKHILRQGVARIRFNINYFKNWMCNETDTITSKPDVDQQSGNFNHSRVFQDSNDLNTAIHRLQDTYSSLSVAINTLRFIRHDFNAELDKDQVKDVYNVKRELRMECDALKRIPDVTDQLARRLVPPRIRQKLVPPKNPIIHLLEEMLNL